MHAGQAVARPGHLLWCDLRTDPRLLQVLGHKRGRLAAFQAGDIVERRRQLLVFEVFEAGHDAQDLAAIHGGHYIARGLRVATSKHNQKYACQKAGGG